MRIETTIRDAILSDAPRIAEIQVSAWKTAYHGMIPDNALDALSVAERTARWNEILAENADAMLVAERDSEVIGWIGFGASRDDDRQAGGAGEVYGLYVAPDRWRGGAGSALWRAACDRMARQGCAAVDVWVLNANGPARRFYEAMGCALDKGVTKMFERDGYAVPEVRYSVCLN